MRTTSEFRHELEALIRKHSDELVALIAKHENRPLDMPGMENLADIPTASAPADRTEDAKDRRA
jgi:hypothetical protein